MLSSVSLSCCRMELGFVFHVLVCYWICNQIPCFHGIQRDFQHPRCIVTSLNCVQKLGLWNCQQLFTCLLWVFYAWLNPAKSWETQEMLSMSKVYKNQWCLRSFTGLWYHINEIFSEPWSFHLNQIHLWKLINSALFKQL